MWKRRYTSVNGVIITLQLYEEVEEVLGGKEPTFEDFDKLVYLELVIKETMRIYPSVSMQTTRVVVDNEQLGPYNIPKGVRNKYIYMFDSASDECRSMALAHSSFPTTLERSRNFHTRKTL
jgi:hypothetical protein